MARIRSAIIGLSDIGAGPGATAAMGGLRLPMPWSHAGAYAAVPDTELVAVCDLRPELLEGFRSQWGAVFPEARAFTDYRELLTSTKLDLLSVVTSDNRHADIVVDACRAGVRAIFCEKPIATTLADADRMIEAAEKAGVVMSVNHTRRWYPLYNLIRERLRAGELGTVNRVVGYLGGPRAMLFRNGSHLIDTILMLLETRPAWVFADLDPGFEEYYTYRGDGGRDPAGDPGGCGYLRFENGARALLCASKGTPPGFSIDLYGERGHLRIHEGNGAVMTIDGRSERLREPSYRLSGTAAGIDELVRCLSGELDTVSCPPRTARMVLEVLLGLLRSQELGHCPVAIGKSAPARLGEPVR